MEAKKIPRLKYSCQQYPYREEGKKIPRLKYSCQQYPYREDCDLYSILAMMEAKKIPRLKSQETTPIEVEVPAVPIRKNKPGNNTDCSRRTSSTHKEEEAKKIPRLKYTCQQYMTGRCSDCDFHSILAMMEAKKIPRLKYSCQLYPYREEAKKIPRLKYTCQQYKHGEVDYDEHVPPREACAFLMHSSHNCDLYSILSMMEAKKIPRLKYSCQQYPYREDCDLYSILAMMEAKKIPRLKYSCQQYPYREEKPSGLKN
ncbi:uncharacterized protein LOC134279245 [Saccostrea cucullata]|uniref:uncharacterized protein LOC134279245 n=1 Tax=Saccostrea cuccullata TaxID=36930 RepID=UPI002ED0042A